MKSIIKIIRYTALLCTVFVKAHDMSEITLYIHGTKFPGIDTALEFQHGFIPHGLSRATDLVHKRHPHQLIEALCDSKHALTSRETLYFFGWGGFFPPHRETEAYKLYTELSTYIKKYNLYHTKKRIITHSHGGTIAKYLIHFLEENGLPFVIDELIMMGCPIQKITQDYIDSPAVKKVINIYSKADGVQRNDPQGLYPEAFKDGVTPPLRSKRTFKKELSHVWQIRVTIDSKSYGHQTFPKPFFLQYLPLIVHTTETVSAGKYAINVITNSKKPVELINVIAN